MTIQTPNAAITNTIAVPDPRGRGQPLSEATEDGCSGSPDVSGVVLHASSLPLFAPPFDGPSGGVEDERRPADPGDHR